MNKGNISLCGTTPDSRFNFRYLVYGEQTAYGWPAGYPNPSVGRSKPVGGVVVSQMRLYVEGKYV